VEISVRPATIHDAISLGPRMKREDADEAYAAIGLGPQASLILSLQASEVAGTGLIDGIPIVMFGVVRDGNKGMPWLLGSSDIQRVSRRFLRESKLCVREMKKRFDLLENFVDARHTVSIHWLRWLGFTIHDAEPYGFEHRPFHRFEMRQ